MNQSNSEKVNPELIYPTLKYTAQLKLHHINIFPWRQDL